MRKWKEHMMHREETTSPKVLLKYHSNQVRQMIVRLRKRWTEEDVEGGTNQKRYSA